MFDLNKQDQKYRHYGSPFIQTFTPLVSPVVHNVQNLSLSNNFAPLESPALTVQNGFELCNDNYILSPPNSFHLQPYQVDDQFVQNRMQITPSQLLLLNEQEEERKLIPLLPQSTLNATAVDLLSTKSNYENMVDGSLNKLGVASTSGTIKKTSHKEAEQKRRDTLKNSFKVCKSVLPPFKEKAPSKVAILHKARDYILELKHENESSEVYIQELLSHLKNLDSLLASNGIIPPAIPTRSNSKQRDQ